VSVAFRRESDEEHLEPKFELPIPPGPNLVTPRGAALIAARMGELEAAVAAGGDEETLKALKRDLRYWRTRHATAQVMAAADGRKAAFGTRVSYRLNGGAAVAVEIVGDDEADPKARRIAFSSPIARALIGAEAGEFVDFGGKDEAIELVSVDVLP
jgi:transcription elongation GreA/GreB family factor